jgi:hypothetical protein
MRRAEMAALNAEIAYLKEQVAICTTLDAQITQAAAATGDARS